jgi:hypothetical protein
LRGDPDDRERQDRRSIGDKLRALEERRRDLKRRRADGELNEEQYREEEEKLNLERRKFRQNRWADAMGHRIERLQQRISELENEPGADDPQRKVELGQVKQEIQNMRQGKGRPFGRRGERDHSARDGQTPDDKQLKQQRERFRKLAEERRDRMRKKEEARGGTGRLLIIVSLAVGATVVVGVILQQTVFKRWRQKKSDRFPSSLDAQS